MKNFFKKLGNFVWSKSFLINFSALIVVYLIIFYGVQAWLDSKTNHGEEVPVPNLIGKNSNNVKSLLNGTELNYEVLDSIYEPTLVEGTIIQQDPLPTNVSALKVKKGRKVKLRVSKRTMLVEMPRLIDKSQRFAEGVLRNRDFRYTLEYKPSREADGAVLEQWFNGKKIEGGKKIPVGSKIKLVIGRNEVGVPLDYPNLYGLTVVDARRRVDNMMNMEFMLGVCEGCITSEDSTSAFVYDQSPEYVEGMQIASGGSIVVMARMSLEPKE